MQDETLGVTQLVNGAWSRVPQRRSTPLARSHCLGRRAELYEGRKRVLGIMAAILASLHMQTADDLFGGPQGSPRSDKLIAASVQWAEKIMEKIDNAFRSSDLP